MSAKPSVGRALGGIQIGLQRKKIKNVTAKNFNQGNYDGQYGSNYRNKIVEHLPRMPIPQQLKGKLVQKFRVARPPGVE